MPKMMRRGPLQTATDVLRTQSRLTLLVFAFCCAGGWAILHFQRSANRDSVSALQIVNLRHNIDELSSLEWRVYADSAESKKILDQAQRRLTVLKSACASLQGWLQDPKAADRVIKDANEYAKDVQTELTYAAEGNMAAAKRIDEEFVDPQYQSLRRHLDDLQRHMTSQAEQDESFADIGAILCVIAITFAAITGAAHSRRRSLDDAIDRTKKDDEHRYERSIQNVPGVLYQFRLDPTGQVTFPYVSPQSEVILGIPAEEIMRDASLLLAALGEKDFEELQKMLAVSARDLSPFVWEVCGTKQSTLENRWVRVISNPEAQSDGSVIWDGIFIDITDLKLADLLARQKHEAETANRAKSEFLSRMSHELRTPLNAILGFGQVLEMSTTDAQSLEMIRHLMGGGRHLLTLINEVLDISRIETRSFQVSIEPVNLQVLLEECCDLLGPLAHERNVRVVVDSKAVCGKYARADIHRLRQVVLNLLANAIKYNSVGGLATLTAKEAPNDRMLVSVSDTGIGIPADKKDRLFVPFDRLGAEHSSVEGTGLGLALSKKLLEAMGGNLYVEDAPGGGCVFTADLPIARAPELLLSVQTPEGTASRPKRGLVLYIEDNFSSTRLMETIAERAGVEFRTVTQGRLGFEEAKALEPDVILLDLDLPDLKGMEVLNMLRRNPITCHIPVVIVSADANPSRRTAAMKNGAREYITKPIEVSELLETLRSLIPDISSAA